MPGISFLCLSNWTLRPPGYDFFSIEQLKNFVVQEELLANPGEQQSERSNLRFPLVELVWNLHKFNKPRLFGVNCYFLL